MFLNFCNIPANLGLTICELLRISSCFSALRYSWIIPKITTICLLFILSSHGELLIGNLIQLLLVCSGDIEINPGPKTKNQILFCHWNLNGLAARNCTKVSLLQALSVTHDYGIICLSETLLDSPSSNDDERINTVLKATIFYGHTIQVTKKEQAFVCIINNTFLLLKERIYVP